MQTSQPKYLPKGAKLFEGEYREIMPAIIEAGLVPVSPAWVIDRRNKSAGKNNQDDFWNIRLDTDCGIAADTKKVYLFPHSKELRSITPNTELTRDGIADLDISKAKVYSRADLKLNKALTEEEARTYPVWQEIAESQKILDKYVGNTFKIGKDKFNYDKMMGLYVPDGGIQWVVVLSRLFDGANAEYMDLSDEDFHSSLIAIRDVSAKQIVQQAREKNQPNELEKICRKAGITELRNAL